VDGLLAGAAAAGLADPPVLGVVAAHASCDFVRTFGIPPGNADFAARRLVEAPPYPIDVAAVSFHDPAGAVRRTHVAGVIQIGMLGAAVRAEARMPAWLGRARFFSAFWAQQLAYRPREVTVTGERREFRGRATTLVIANCQWNRAGVRVSPRSFPGDGTFELSIWTGPKSDAFRLLPRMFQGEHLPHPRIAEHRVRHVRVEGERPLAVEADGVWLGWTPVSVDLLPEAVTLRI
jgi:diacylglycerol kinase family enzyme